MVVVVIAATANGGSATTGHLSLAFTLRLHPPESAISEPGRNPLEEVPREASAATANRSGSRYLTLHRRSGMSSGTVTAVIGVLLNNNVSPERRSRGSVFLGFDRSSSRCGVNGRDPGRVVDVGVGVPEALGVEFLG
ncbi:hypothetical protein V8G54_017025 [Vigna mungo]|uniref:Uncharacterized protein n=1 Tax=Vigna mungo TaxID=3915 RepID=A0AAQ3NL71_VIGMU